MNIFLRIIDDKLCCAGCIRETTQEIRFQTGSVSLMEAFNYLKANGLRWLRTEFPPAVKDFLHWKLLVASLSLSLAGAGVCCLWVLTVGMWWLVTCSALGPDLCQLPHIQHWTNNKNKKKIKQSNERHFQTYH